MKKTKKDICFPDKTFRNREGLYCYDLKIEYVRLSTRAYNYLIAQNIRYLSEIMNIDEKTLQETAGIGGGTVNELLTLKKDIPIFVENRIVNNVEYNNLSKLCLDIIKEIRLKKDIDGAKYYDVIYEILSVDQHLYDKKKLYENVGLFVELSNNDFIKNFLMEILLDIIENASEGIKPEEIADGFPRGFNSSEIIQKSLDGLLKEESIVLEDDRYVIKYISIFDYANTLKKESYKNLLLARLHGKTLEEIGNEVDLTRERVRQVVKKVLDNRPVVLEDKYKKIYTKYNFEKEQFEDAFGVDDSTYCYLNICYSKGNRSIAECFEDEELSKKDMKNIERVIYKKYLLIGTEYIMSQRSSICEYVIRTFATDEITYDEFYQLYHSILEDFDLLGEEKYSIEGRGYENKLVMSEYVLWKYGRKLRYYNIHAYDFNELISTLNLYKYMNLEISTLLLFRNHEDLMDTYDIRDEYELHNLLKKITKDESEIVKFNRMPNIEIGIANRDRQVFELLSLNAPIENFELAKKYEEEYGVMANTVLANYFKDIAIYLHAGIYKMDNPVPSETVLEGLKYILVNDFYTLIDAKKAIREVYPGLETTFINPYVLKSVGYKIYSLYIIKDCYQSAVDYFKILLTKNDLINLKNISQDIINLAIFKSELARLKAEYEIMEYAPSKYINYRKLEKNGVTKDKLNDYCDLVFRSTKDGEYFTINSLRNAEVEGELNELGFDALFYASILSESKSKFKFRRVGNNKLFYKGNKAVYLSDFIEYIMLKSDLSSMDIYDLIDLVKEKYRIFLEKHKIVEVIKGTTMYYDRIYDKVYLDYSVYYEEV